MRHNNGIGRRRLLAAAAGTAIGTVAAGFVGAPATAKRLGPYRFPIVPGTPAWAGLNTTAEMVAATQLPDGLAERMSTEELVSTVLAYPLLTHALASDDGRAGLRRVLGGFNAANELLHRPDAASVLLKRYGDFDPAVPSSASGQEAGGRTLDAWRIEGLLSQPGIVDTATGGHREKLLRIGRAKLDVKNAYAHIYGAGNLGTGGTADLLLRTLTSIQAGPSGQPTCAATNGGAVASIRDAVDQHLDGVGTQACIVPLPADPFEVTYSYISTPLGTKIQIFHMPGLSSAQVSCLNAESDRMWPQATRETNATQRYNCHSYAWYSTSDSGNSWWMERMWFDKAQRKTYPNVSRYWTDGSWLRWNPPLIYFSGMRWVYWSADQSDGGHSGIEVGTSGYLRSKWGPYGRMYHRWDYVPAAYPTGDIRQYYR